MSLCAHEVRVKQLNSRMPREWSIKCGVKYVGKNKFFSSSKTCPYPTLGDSYSSHCKPILNPICPG